MSKMKFMAVTAAMIMVAATASAQPGGGRGGFGGNRGGAGGFRGGGDSLVELALRDDVSNALEIVGPQKEDIEKIRDDIRSEMQGMRDKLRDVPREEIFTKMRELITEANEKGEKALSDVLLPQQISRLKQLQFQRRARGGTTRALGRDDVKDALGLSDDQMEKIQEAAEEAQKELEEEVAKLREEAQKKILAVLSPSQRKQWEEMMGEPFKFEQPERRQFGGQGGPGGGRPGGGRPGGGRPGGDGGRPRSE